ncbi:MAG: SIMPL domain-containing protein [Neisseria sp.]|nr:SIMPL domain-containing protein [Neisseria sp.]
MLKRFLLIATLGIAAMNPLSAEPLNYNIITLSSSARESVQRDTMQVVFSIRENGRDRTTVSNTVTERSNRVLQKIRANKALQGELSARNIYPHYPDGNPKKAQIWQDEARITVRSKDFEALTKLMAAVQNDAAVDSLAFTVSRDLQEKTRKNLTESAIRNFREQAQTITRALGSSSYKIVSLNINSNDYNGYAYAAAPMMRAKAEYAGDAAPVPEAEAGDQEITMNVSGSIQVQ